jgi:hypothetical protein
MDFFKKNFLILIFLKQIKKFSENAKLPFAKIIESIGLWVFVV